MSIRALAVATVLFATACPSKNHTVRQPPPIDQVKPVELSELTEHQHVRGFEVVALYLDGTGAPMGARFVHDETKFVFDYLRVESAPQGFLWVGSYPTSDQGEPHTQEHLLLGKGDRGRAFGNFQAMALAESSAFTAQFRTCYHFHTVAAHEVFWPVFADQLDGLLHPDYTDEEIRREVANFGVSQDPDGTVRLEEGGTVYNEMVRTFESPITLIWDAAGRMQYGETHPLARSSGGVPDAIRRMTPEDIRAFHASTHYLGNMGMIGSFPASMALGDVLDRTSKILGELNDRTGDAMTAADLPPPDGAEAGATRLVDYPFADANKPSTMMLAWPASRSLPLDERLLMELFLSSFAGDEGTPLYKALVDTKTRTLDVGATAVWTYVVADPGQPVYLGLSGVVATSLTEAGIEQVREVVRKELARIAALGPDDDELKELNARVASRLIDTRRRLAKFLNSPPRFGFRGIQDEWIRHLDDVIATPGFAKSLTLTPELATIEQVLAGDGNPWTARIAAWGLDQVPYGLAARPSPAARKALDTGRQARIDAEVARLGTQWGLTDPAAITAKFKEQYDANTRALEDSAKAAKLPPFVDTPPMTLDDDLKYDQVTVDRIPVVASRIDSMTGGTVAIAFRLDAVAEDDLPLLALLPRLLQDTGTYVDGVATPSDEVKEALRREILSLSIYYSTNATTGRVELVASGAGTDLAETRKALAWVAQLLAHPDWRTDNLPRLRDVVEQSLTSYRQIMLGAEEGWVQGPPEIYGRQRSPLLAHTASFLTQTHDLHRLRWMLSADPDDDKTTAAVALTLRGLAAAGSLGRAELERLATFMQTPPTKASGSLVKFTRTFAAQPPKVRALVAQAGKDLRALLADLPDDSLAADWTYLCKQMAADLERGPTATLAALERVRARIVDVGEARGWMVSSTDNAKALQADLGALLATLPAARLDHQIYSDARFIDDRLRGRQPTATAPRFIALVNPNTSSGVFVHTAPSTSFADTSDDALLDYLSGNLYTGHGGHSMFMKTWAAGLAYSNGLRVALSAGRILYYAERCPELPQTMRFVIGQLEAATVDPQLAEYAIAQSFNSRVAGSYESRAAAIANDLADGITPERVRTFRTKLLALRGKDGLAAELFARMPQVYGKVLPGYGVPSADVDDAVFFTTGPTSQLDAWQTYLTATEGKDAVLWRLYPRDFWVPAKL